MFIAVSGVIGVGKSSFLEYYENHKIFTAVIQEPLKQNHFFQLVNKEKGFAFGNQIEFLLRFMDSYKENSGEKHIVRDRVVEEVMLFTDFMFSRGDLTLSEYEYFKKCYDRFKPGLRTPDVVFQLHLSTSEILDRIISRGRGEEKALNLEYLTKLNEFYAHEFKNYFPTSTQFKYVPWSDAMDSKETRYERLKDRINEVFIESCK